MKIKYHIPTSLHNLKPIIIRLTLYMGLVMVLMASVSQASLVLNISMNEGVGTYANDTSGYNNNGTLNGSTWTQYGISGNASLFQWLISRNRYTIF